MTANLQFRGHRASIICVYAPSNDAPKTEKDNFYEQLEEGRALSWEI